MKKIIFFLLNIFGTTTYSIAQNTEKPYNIMKDIQLVINEKYKDMNYEKIDHGIFVDKRDKDITKYRMTLSFNMENADSDQYPLEDLLDENLLYISDFYEDLNAKESNFYIYEFAGELDDLKNLKKIIGKKVFYVTYKNEGQIMEKMCIE